MTNTRKLKGLMAEKGLIQNDVAEKIGISYCSFNYKLNNIRDFTQSEIKKLCDLLNIEDKDAYFFATSVDK